MNGVRKSISGRRNSPWEGHLERNMVDKSERCLRSQSLVPGAGILVHVMY